MRVLIAGGRGFLGSALRRELISNGHSVKILTRSGRRDEDSVGWDGRGLGAWTRILQQTDAVVNACGYGLEHWPWTPLRKRRFVDSRVLPGIVLARAIEEVEPRPRVLIQFSGINRYGIGGDTVAEEATPAADDFLAQLTVPWENSTRLVEEVGVRRVIVRNGIVLARRGGLFPVISLPAKLLFGGRLGNGRQAVPWIHVTDHVRALRYLLEADDASGAYNLVAPSPSTNAEFMEAICDALRRPYWFHVPSALARLVLGEMADLVLGGRPSVPRRLLEAGFQYHFPHLHLATLDLLSA